MNSRLDSIHAAVLDAKLPNLDEYNQKRKEAAKKYDEAFKGNPNIEIPYRSGDNDNHVFHQYTLKVKNYDRDGLAAFLNQNEILPLE